MCTHKDNADLQAVVFDIQRCSLVDGPGIRTTVFLKGCPLRCAWCHNPEAMSRAPETVQLASGESKTYGITRTVAEVMAIVRKDRAYYAESGGGLTISGGEPMVSFPFTRELAASAAREGISVAIDTAGAGRREDWEAILPDVSLFLFDYKVTDEVMHKKLTGIERRVPLESLTFLAARGARIRLRCPIIPGVNDNADHLRAIAGLASMIPNLDGVNLLPYHSTARHKHEQLGRGKPMEFAIPSDEDLSQWRSELDKLMIAGSRTNKEPDLID